MSKSTRPDNMDFSAMERKLRELGIEKDIDHLSHSRSKALVSQADSKTTGSRTRKMTTQRQTPVQHSLPEETTQEPSDWCNYVFGTLLSIYESTWIKSYGGRPTGRFLDFADTLTEEQLMRIIQHCRERLQAGETWPPIMGELTILRTQLTVSELMDAQMRVLNKEPANQIEKWIIQNKGFELRRMPQSILAKRFKEFYLEGMKLQEKGKLRTELPKAIAPHSVKNLNDIKREEYKNKHGSNLNPRIQAIIDSKSQ